MRLSTLLEMPPEEIEDIEAKIKRNFFNVGIVLNFTKHFGARIVDGAKDAHSKRDNITSEEIMSVFERIKTQHKKIFKEATDFTDELKRGAFEGVIKDEFTKINVPFGLIFDKTKGRFIITCKTIMKRDKFHTKPTDHVIKV